MFREEQNHEPKHRDGQVTWGGVQGRVHTLEWKDGGREADPEDLRYHVEELGLYPPGFGGSIEGV